MSVRYLASGKRRSSIGRLLAVLSAAAVVAGCSSSASTGGTSSSGGSSGASTVQIGIITDTTGIIAAAGKQFLDGVLTAQSMINSEHTLGSTTIDIVQKQGAADPATSASVASQLAANPSILATICCILTPVVGALKPIAIAAKMPMVIYGATDTGLPQPPYVFQTNPLPELGEQQFSDITATADHIKTYAINVQTDNSGIVAQGNSYIAGMSQAGAKNLGEVGTTATTTDFSSPASALVSKNPQAIVVAATQTAALNMIAAIHNLGYKGLILGGNDMLGTGVYQSNPAAFGPVLFPVDYLPSDTNALGRQFNAAYTKQWGSQPQTYAAEGFTALDTLAQALKQVKGTPTRASLTTALNAMKSLADTIYGPVTFQKGNLVKTQPTKIVHYASNGSVVEVTP
jgi:ABC-type branched-subunit amino acid transport system substrate-binding protein